MAQRLRQMAGTNSSENKVNWNIKLGSKNHRSKIIKSVGNFVLARGDGVYDNKELLESIFGE